MSISLSQELLISTAFVLLVPLGLYLYSRFSRRRSKNLPTNWPIMHMFPSFVANAHNIHDYITMVLAGSGHNFRAHGPPGFGLRFFITCDPMNVQHIFTTNYTNFPKGEDFAAIFDIMAGSIFTIDGEMWRRSRAKAHSFFNSPRLVTSMAASCRDKLENDLLPLFTRMVSATTPIDMQELMLRSMFDVTATLIFGVDPHLLSMDMPPMDVSAAMDTVMEVGYLRHMMPAYCWKLMRRLNIGHEKKLDTDRTVIHGFVTKMMERRKINGEHVNTEDFLSACINDPDNGDDELLRATLINFMLGGRDTVSATLSWIFYNLAENPTILSIIRNELTPIASCKVFATGHMVIFDLEETKSLVYLKAALYETLRLYPPVPMERKTVATNDIMPSGHVVQARDTILISIHSMGRMQGLWGKDCLNYNPYRWLSEDGNKLRYVPSHKFLAFNSVPRFCPCKDIAVMLMMTVVATVVWNFDLEVVEGQSIQPKSSCILQMKNGLTMKLKKREM